MLLKEEFLMATRSQLASSIQINSRRGTMSDVVQLSEQDQFAIHVLVECFKGLVLR